MDQVKTGKFIAQARRAQNLTQRQLADQLAISDKTGMCRHRITR